MNRQDYRKKYNIKTKYRILGTHYAKHNKTFLAEHEEVVVSSDSFTYEDFLEEYFRWCMTRSSYLLLLYAYLSCSM